MELVELLLEKIATNVLPTAMAENQRSKISAMVLSQVTEEDLSELSPLEMRELVDLVYRDYITSQIEPGKLVGVIAATSLGESQTQASLNTHRTAGLAAGRESFSGLPRLLQVVENTSPTIPTMFLYPKLRKTVREMKRLITTLQYTLVADVLESQLLKPQEEIPDLPFHSVYNTMFRSTKKSKWILRLTFDVQKLYDRRILLSTIGALIVSSIRDVQTVFSDLATGIIDVYYHGSGVMENYGPITKPGEDAYYYIRDTVIPGIRGLQLCGILGIEKTFLNSVQMTDVVTDVVVSGSMFRLKVDQNIMKFRGIQVDWVQEWVTEQLNDDALFSDQQQWEFKSVGFRTKDEVLSALHSGTDIPVERLYDHLGHVDPVKVALHEVVDIPPLAQGEVVHSELRVFLSEYWFVETRGINLKDIQFITEFDPRFTWCNDCDTIVNNYGIEAARYWQEYESNLAGMASASRDHKTLLFDSTTRDGVVRAVNRHGLEGSNQEFLTQSLFEESTISFLQSAHMGRSDSISGVAASTVTSNLGSGGTNFSDVIFQPKLSELMATSTRTKSRPGMLAPRSRSKGK
jgi:hypothetical protein